MRTCGASISIYEISPDKGLFEAAGMHPFRVRLIDKARLIINRFSRAGLLQQILAKMHEDELPSDPQ